MKVRIGIGSGGGSPTELADLVDRLEKLEVDSLWLSEHLSTPAVDPLVGMAFALGRTSQLKVGTGVAVLPGRNPVLLAKQLSSLALLAPRRVLLVLGLGPARLEDRSAFPLPEARGETRPAGTVGRRGAVFDEALEVLRRLLREPQVTFHGEFFDFTEISIGELPTRPLEIWLGGSTPAALRRIGRFGDGWLATGVDSPERVAAGIAEIQRNAAAAGRRIDDDHFGLSLRVAFEPPPAEAVEALRRRFPDSDPALVLPVGWATTRKLIGEYIAVGVSKFVIHPFSTPGGWPSILDSFAAELMPLEN
ncbi:TIGR03854 family LLM class F420-dependent oxidoreductase [Candidatus Frankia alpina]|uniref:TIGR03854 family LLM class F420-dependent oxidoreductase n=1 Tax=Candidatus Frankia alpina TaxID=2699483 RepID=A0A4V6S8F2_9ACTN|nr:TIGR03854 family LLM class F420-dependent oxidoreductase [Candidatus Frankia alpina]THJ75279.1 TIGR03854 family LLM class F420-dependent oxidoreductase [Candidatus Frankia alpina]